MSVVLPAVLQLQVLLVGLVVLVVLSFCQGADSQPQQQTTSPEALFRKTVSEWQSQQSWGPWKEFSKELGRQFVAEAEQPPPSSPPNDTTDVTLQQQQQQQQRNRLEMIGALEEGILMIEKTIFQYHQRSNSRNNNNRAGGLPNHDDRLRDQALSQLYMTYGNALSQLSAEECLQLALDPHTLLIGAETVVKDSKTSEPSTFLCLENAENSLRNAITLDATNSEAETFLQSILGDDNNDGTTSSSVHKRKPKEFVAELFDSFADSFDTKLKRLEYKVPQLVGELAQQLVLLLRTAHDNDDDNTLLYYRNVLDAGCGTGLAGRFLRPLMMENGSVMVGVDASQKMLNVANKCTRTSGCGLPDAPHAGTDNIDHRPLYDNLLVFDLEDMTLENTLLVSPPKKSSNEKKEENTIRNEYFDLIVAADVLVYFGSLETILQVFANLSSSSSYLIFSCERATTEDAPLGWRLLPSGRFAHTKQHVIDVALQVGYELVSYEEIIPRMERDEPVQGHLFGFQLHSLSSSFKSSSAITNNRTNEEL